MHSSPQLETGRPVSAILVAVDDSDGAVRACRFAFMLAKTLDAELRVLHVWQCPPAVRAAESAGATLGNKLGALLLEQAEASLGTLLERALLPPGIAVSTELREGNPSREILEAIRLGNYQLVVLGTHGRSGLGHLMLGSVAERVVRLSPVPVVTVPAAQS
jgi:universal stress protein A